MTRLNSSIKLIMMVGEAIFLLLAIAMAILSTLVSSGEIHPLNFTEAHRNAQLILLISIGVIFCTIFGCCGAVNQIIRKGACAGRRILSLHQLLLFCVLALSYISMKQLRLRERSISVVLSDITQYPVYDSFETHLDRYFNSAYFEGICADNSSSVWIMDWVNRNCPLTMGKDACELSAESREVCDTTCKMSPWQKESCCPSENLCLVEEQLSTCPYNQCRFQVLKEARSMIKNGVTLLQVFACLSIIMIIFTCLLICYNPRDEIEIELLKTGVMTEDDIETIKKLKNDNIFSYEKGNGNTQGTINLDSLIDSGRRVTRRVMRRSKTKSRIYPHQTSSP